MPLHLIPQEVLIMGSATLRRHGRDAVVPHRRLWVSQDGESYPQYI